MMLILGDTRTLIPEWSLGSEPYSWTFNSVQILALSIVVGLYVRRARRLATKGQGPEAWRLACFAIGITVVAAAFISPLDSLGETRLFLAHMLQHILLGDIGPIFLTLGLTGPLLRPVLALPLVRRIHTVVQPGAAFVAWGANLAIWHIPPAYALALGNPYVHIFEHACFFTFGCFLWASITEPVRGPRWFGSGWKVALVVGICLTEGLLANMLFWSRDALYAAYIGAPRTLGLSAVTDMNYGGALMMTNGTLLGLVVIAFLFYRISTETELQQRLVEAGIPEERSRRAVRAGHGAELLAAAERRNGTVRATTVGIADR